FVEKPLALDIDDAEALCAAADAGGRVLMVGHLLRYHPAFVALARLVSEGQVGDIRYLYSNRLNLGLVRRHEDTLWSFAPHDVSMILALVGAEPGRVWATGGAWLHDDVADVTTTHLSFPGGQRAHVFVSWLHPSKEQRLVVVGERAMAVFDDGRPWPSKLRLFRHGIDWRTGVGEGVPDEGECVPLEEAEPLEVECRHFLDCVAGGCRPLTDGAEGVRVLRVLAAAAQSLAQATAPAADGSAAGGGLVHETAVVDQPATIGSGTRIWHFSHVLAGSRIGRDCTIGQNVMIGPRVVIGDRCKIQNGVSVYEGVTLEEGVFCGPACVFTNVLTPRAEVDRRAELLSTLVQRGATIGANATIVCGTTIGPWSFVAAGAVVTRDVPAHALVAGVPARRMGWVSHDGERLGDDLVCPRSGRRYALVGPDRLEEVTDDPARAPAPVDLVDLGAQRRRLGRRVDRALGRVLDHGHFVMGPEVGRLEEELARYCGARHAVTTASGSDALVVGLLALGVKAGDAVVVPSFTFASTAEVVALVGATPVFADVRPDTFTLDLDSVAAAADALAGGRVVGVIPVDLFGHPADYPALNAWAAARGMWVMADAAQSFGAALGGRAVGTLAPVTTTSFFPAKPLGCYGDGGAIFTDDDDLAARLRSLRAHGVDGTEHVAVGINGRLDTIQAAVLLEKLAVFDEELAARQQVAGRYASALAGQVEVPRVGSGVRSAWACYTIQVAERDKVAARLHDESIATAVYYRRPVADHPAYRSFPRPPGGLPVAERLSRAVLSLPIHPYLDEPSQDRVIDAVRTALT
ncbi:MAG: aminotransferase class I/II-fold pyridoxal phosphate-dependent enzyme, partial [Acidimicrobiales bacterium]